MESHSLENWKKVKDYMEANGKTDNDYYKRAKAIVAGKQDPWRNPFGDFNTIENDGNLNDNGTTTDQRSGDD